MLLLQHIVDYLIANCLDFSYLAILAMLIVCGLGIPIPEDLTLLAAGVICALSLEGSTPLHLNWMIIVCIFGIITGDSIMFLLGYFLKDQMSDFFIFKSLFKHKYYKVIQRKMSKVGYGFLFTARFLPGVRALIFVVAGSSHRVNYFLFVLVDLLAALISVPLIVYAGYHFANDLSYIVAIIKRSELLFATLIIMLVLLFIGYKYYKRRKS
jgi:membrane protein DedA with SNARE-associated domain